MKIIISLCTKDEQFRKRLVGYFQTHYFERFIWNEYDDVDMVLNGLNITTPDIVIVDQNEITDEQYKQLTSNEKISLLYLSEEESEKENVIYKYNKGDYTYRQILSVYAQKENINYHFNNSKEDDTEIFTVVSAMGGAGTTTIAAAIAQYYAKYERVLYINLEDIGITELVFKGDDRPLDDILFSLKSRRQSLDVKIESAVTRDASGVFFFGAINNPLDIMELKNDELKELLQTIKKSNVYKKIILDVGNNLSARNYIAFEFARKIIMVMEESDIADVKLNKYLQAIQRIENYEKMDISSKLEILLNKGVNNQRTPDTRGGYRVLGTVPQVMNAGYKETVNRISMLEVLDKVRM